MKPKHPRRGGKRYFKVSVTIEEFRKLPKYIRDRHLRSNAREALRNKYLDTLWEEA